MKNRFDCSWRETEGAWCHAVTMKVQAEIFRSLSAKENLTILQVVDKYALIVRDIVDQAQRSVSCDQPEFIEILATLAQDKYNNPQSWNNDSKNV